MVDSGLVLLLVPLLPLAAGLLSLLVLRRAPLASGLCGAGSLLGSALCALLLLLANLEQGSRAQFSVDWIRLTAWQAADGYALFPELNLPLALSAGFGQLLFILTTALLSAFIVLYALRERQGDPRAAQFHATLVLFSASMLLLLCADTLLLVYAAWELLGLFSYLLIAHKGSAEALRSARQAFWTTRATDMGLLLAIIILMAGFGWSQLSAINVGGLLQGIASTAGADALQLIQVNYALLGGVALLVVLAVLGKSAQWPLSFWLADAMVAPVPVSALLHAATLVAAGPFFLFMLRPLLLPRMLQISETEQLYFAPQAAYFALCLLGGLSLIFGGLMALCSRDAKRVLAYSTVSQLGLCLCGIGVYAEQAAYFYLLVHAWCKAALFLGIGLLAAQTAGGSSALELLAGRARRNWPLLLGLGLAAASLASVPGLAGSVAKEEILWALWSRPAALFPGFSTDYATALPLAALGARGAAVCVLLSLPLTAAYLARLLLKLVWGRTASTLDTQAAGTASSGWQLPRLICSACAVLGSLACIWLYAHYRDYYRVGEQAWQWMPEEQRPGYVALGALLLLLGVAGAWAAGRSRPLAVLDRVSAFFDNGMRLREFWQRAIAGGGLWLAGLVSRTEEGFIARSLDGLGSAGRGFARTSSWVDTHIVDGIRWQACELWWHIRRWHNRWMQTGDVQHYLLVILLGAVILCIVVIRPLSHIFATVLNRM